MATTPLDPCSPVEERLQLAEGLFDIVERAMNHTRATGSAIVLRRDNEWLVRTSNAIAPDVGAAILYGDGVVGNCARTGKPFTGTVEEAAIDAVLKPFGVRSLVVAPVVVNGKTEGVLFVTHQVAEAFSRMHAAIMMTMSGEIATMLKRYETATKEQAQPQPVAVPLPPRPVVVAAPPAAPARAPQPATSIASSPVEATKKTEIPTAVPKTEVVPLKLMIDQPIAPKPVKAVETVKPAPVEPARVSSTTLFELESNTAKPAADVLGFGEDPHKYGRAIKPATKPAPQVELATFAGKYQPAKQSRPIAPLVAVAVLVVAGTAFGAWRHYYGSATPAAHETAAAATPSPAPAAAATPTPVVEPPATVVVAKDSSPKTEPVKTDKKQEVAAVKKQETLDVPPTPTPTQAPALRLASAAAKEKVDVPAVDAPALNVLAGSAMPQFAAPKPVSAHLVVKKTTVVPAVAIRMVPPVYPDIARRNGTSGDVKLQMTVSTTGKVTSINVISGPPMLRQAATNAVALWQYKPATLDGRAIESTVEVTVKFEAR